MPLVHIMIGNLKMGMKKVVSIVRNKELDCKIIIGGAPITQDIVYFFGADG